MNDAERDPKPAGGHSLAARDLTAGYGRDLPRVLDALTLDVPPGRVTCLIGPNGSGKSTLLKALGRQLARTGGAVLVDGADFARATRKQVAQTLGILFQENRTPSGLTVEMLVEHGRYPHRGFLAPFDERDRDAVERALALTGTATLRGRRVERLSGGQRQLVWIAMALAQKTGILLLDEPTTFLDMAHQLQVMEVLDRLRTQEEITIVAVMHDVNLAARHADHVILLRDGAVVTTGPAEQVITPEWIRRAYDVDGHLVRDPATGAVVFVADRRVDA